MIQTLELLIRFGFIRSFQLLGRFIVGWEGGWPRCFIVAFGRNPMLTCCLHCAKGSTNFLRKLGGHRDLNDLTIDDACVQPRTCVQLHTALLRVLDGRLGPWMVSEFVLTGSSCWHQI